jgi:hypothetical protein
MHYPSQGIPGSIDTAHTAAGSTGIDNTTANTASTRTTSIVSSTGTVSYALT